MLLRIILRLVVVAGFMSVGSALAAMPPTLWSKADSSAPVSTEIKPVAIIYFTGSTAIPAHTEMVSRMAKQARSELGLVIDEYALADEKNLTETVEKIADGRTGLIVIVEPHDIDKLMSIPSLYPDINFSIIGVEAPLYLTNVRSMLFKEPEGTFLMGVLASLHSQTGSVGFVSKDDNEATRNLAYAFFQGARYAKSMIEVDKQLGVTSSLGKPIFNPSDEADVEFILDPDLFEVAAHDAKDMKRLIIPFDRDLTSTYPGIVLTSLLKHYDLAIYSTLKHYRMRDWRPGTQTLGVGDGYIDYVLEGNNRDLLPKDMIEKVEMSKDLVAQGIVKVVPLGQ